MNPTIENRNNLVKTLDDRKAKPSVKAEPFYYCTYGGIAPICSDCSRNHINSVFRTEDIENWYNPDHNAKFSVCYGYVKTKEIMKKDTPITLDILERNGFQVLSSIVNTVGNLTTVSADTAIYKAEWGYMKIVNMGQQYGWNLTQIWYGKAVPTNSVMVESVSELQLALKVFKVNLKIKL